ncbi:hypothetical protein ACFVRB_08280 [Streptomyces nojiriensis]|uniref:hypothetical protein n=1 Tax=Streptomyces nojiriensis TaxID=66374 RepID=UPI0036DAFE37
MRHGTMLAAAGCAVAVLATAACTLPPAPALSPSAVPAQPAPAPSWTPSAPAPSSPVPSPPAPSPTASEPPRASGPAEPVGDARATAADGRLLAAVRAESGARVPDDGSVIVIHREPAGDAGELAWLPDDRNYCLAVVRDARASTTCNPLPKSWARIGIRLVTEGVRYHEGPTVYFAVVDGGHAPYAYTGPGPQSPGMGPVRDATAAFASGRTLSLLTYERPADRLLPGDREICSADNAVCFPALDVYVPGSP